MGSTNSGPHRMRRAVPGDQKCAECGLTRGAKAHRMANRPAPDVTDAGTVPVIPEVVIAETAGELADKYHGWFTNELVRDVASFAEHAVAGRGQGTWTAADMAREGVRRAVALYMRPDAPPNCVPVAFMDAVRTVLAGTVPAGTDTAEEHASVPSPVAAPQPDSEHAPDTVPAGVSAVTEGSTMLFTISRKSLVNALTVVNVAVPKRPSVPILSGVLLTATSGGLTVRATNWDVFASADVEADVMRDGTVVVSARELTEWVKKLPSKGADLVTVTLTDACTLRVHAGNGYLDPATMPVEDFPGAPEVPAGLGTVTLADLVAGLGTVAPSAGTDQSQPTLTGISMDAGRDVIRMATTDRCRAVVTDVPWMPAGTGNGWGAVPVASDLVAVGKALKVVAGRKLPGDVTIGARYEGPENAFLGIRYTGPDFAHYTYTVRSMDVGGILPIMGLFPDTVTTTVTVSGADLVDLVARVTAGTKKGTSPVILAFDGTQVTAQYTSDTDQRATETMPGVTVDGPAIEIGFNPFFLADAVASVGTGEITISMIDPNRPAVFRAVGSDATRHLLMPIRITGSAPAPVAPAPVAPAPAKETPEPVASVPPVTHEFVKSATSSRRCAVCDRGKIARVHQVASEDASTVPADTVPAGSETDTAPDPVPADDSAPASFPIVGIVPDMMPAPILPAGILETITQEPGPADFKPYRDEINLCECALCAEVSYNGHHWSDKRMHREAARVLLAHLVAGTHQRVTLRERGAFAKRAHEAKVDAARAAGVTGDELFKIEHPDVWMRIQARQAASDDFTYGSGLGIGDAPIIAEAEEAARKAVAGMSAEMVATVRALVESATWSVETVSVYGQGVNRRRTERFEAQVMRCTETGEQDSGTVNAVRDVVRVVTGAKWNREASGYAMDAAGRQRLTAWLAETAPVVQVASVPADTAPERDQAVTTVPAGTVVTPGLSADVLATVRALIESATWSTEPVRVSAKVNGKRVTNRFVGQVMRLADGVGRLDRETYVALRDTLGGVAGGVWNREASGFVFECGDSGNAWRAATRSGREKVTAWLAEPVPADDQVKRVSERGYAAPDDSGVYPYSAMWELPHSGRPVLPGPVSNSSRYTVARRLVTVIGAVRFEPTMVRVRLEDGTVQRAFVSHIQPFDTAQDTPAPIVPADFGPYAEQMRGCGEQLCRTLADTVTAGDDVQEPARRLLAALVAGEHVHSPMPVEPSPAGSDQVDVPESTVTRPRCTRAVPLPGGWASGITSCNAPADQTTDDRGGHAWCDIHIKADVTSSWLTGWKPLPVDALAAPLESVHVPAPTGPEALPAITAPVMHRFDTSGQAYNASQCRDDIRDGDVLIVESERVAGFLNRAWPIAVTEERGEFHTSTIDVMDIDGGRYAASVALARKVADTFATGDQGDRDGDDQGMTVRLVYPDSAPQGEPAGDQVDTPVQASADETYGAHRQVVTVSATDVQPGFSGDGYRFHLSTDRLRASGTGTRAVGKLVRQALGTARKRLGASFSVVAPARSLTVSVVARPGSTVADWSAVLAVVAGVLGDLAVPAGQCAECDQTSDLVKV